MTYNPNIPQADDLISESQGQILDNFTQLNEVFGKDHVKYDDATVADRGRHKQSTYTELSADPATLVNENAIYTKDVNAISQLFLRKQSSGTVIQMSAEDPIRAQNGTSFLPGLSTGGILIQWGQLSIASGGPHNVNFPTAFTAVPFSITTSMFRGTNSSADVFFIDSVTPPDATSFRVRNSSGSSRTMAWMAIGPGAI